MAQEAFDRVLVDLRSLELEELYAVERAVRQRLETESYSPEEWNAMEALVDAGLMKEIRPRSKDSFADFVPVPVQGKPLSESIVEERR